MTVRHRLDRLFTYARATESSALENFTTEALANALEVDPTPLVRALPDAIVARTANTRVTASRIDTQVRVDGGGIVDLAAELVVDDMPLTLWIEIKAHAGLSGPQLDTYCKAAQSWPGEHKPVVIMLCKYPITKQVPTLRWNTLREQIHSGLHAYWTDLRTFLEEHSVADDSDTPLTSTQLEAAPDARALLRKAARLAHEFLRRADLPDAWRKLEFPASEKKVTSAIARQFVRHGRLVVDSGRYPWLCFGLDFAPAPKLTLWIEFQRNDQQARDAIFKLAANLPTGWAMEANDITPWLGTSQPFAGDLMQETALDWLFKRVQELDGAKILAALPKWRRHDPETGE